MNKYWTSFYWILLAGWITGAALFMARVKGGFLTNYLSDVTFPAWFYIHIRGLWTKDRKMPKLFVFGQFFGISPERALIAIFFVGIISEFKTLFWPSGIITGTFDPFDILSYSIGLLCCYYFDKKETYTDNIDKCIRST
ncbi:MAG: hypothetical protein Q8S23_08960 [Bacteroidales bacterium]|jgi:hypothetical protein|nr:hypothetical protein [Bacteroidales bacterium]